MTQMAATIKWTHAGQPRELTLTETLSVQGQNVDVGCNRSAETGTLWRHRLQERWLTLVFIGNIGNWTREEWATLRADGDRVEVTLSAGEDPVSVTLDRASIWTTGCPGLGPDGCLVTVHGFRVGDQEIEWTPIHRANCMLCGTTDNPGQAIKGKKGGLIVLCDPCRESLAHNTGGVPVGQPGER